MGYKTKNGIVVESTSDRYRVGDRVDRPTGVMTPESLQPASVVPFTQPNESPVPDVTRLFETPAMEATPTETKAQGLSDRLRTLNDSLVGKSSYQAQQEKQFGVNDAAKTILDLNTKLTSLKNEAAAIPLQLQQGAAGRGVTTPVLGQQTNARLRTNAIAALGVSSLMAAAQGSLATAQSMADRAVAAKYEPITEEITALSSNLNVILNSPQYSLEQKNRAQKMLDKQNIRAYEIQKLQENEKSIQQVAIQAAAAGADAVTLEKIQNSKNPVEATQAAAVFQKVLENKELAMTAGITSRFVNKNGEFFNTQTGKIYNNPEEFFRDAGVGSFEEAYQKGLVADYSADLLADREFAQQARSTYWDAGIDVSDTPDEIRAKIQGSRIYREQVRPPQYASSGSSSSTPGGLVDANGNPIKLTAGQADAIAGFDTTASLVDDTLALLRSGVQTGPIAGRTLGLKKLTGNSDPKQLQLEQQLSKLKADFMKSLSGAAVSEQEVARLEKFLPSITDQEDVIDSKLNTLKQEAFRTKDNLLKTLGASGSSVQQPGTTPLIGPDGVTYNVPNDQVDSFLRDGGRRP